MIHSPKHERRMMKTFEIMANGKKHDLTFASYWDAYDWAFENLNSFFFSLKVKKWSSFLQPFLYFSPF